MQWGLKRSHGSVDPFKLSTGRAMMPGGFDAVAQHEADYQQRYKVGHVDKIKWQYS